nr:MAG TPA: hypothetical protein [Caudoviricetes sp.]
MSRFLHSPHLHLRSVRIAAATKQSQWLPRRLYVQYEFLAHILHVCCPRFAGFARFLNPNENGLYIKTPPFH